MQIWHGTTAGIAGIPLRTADNAFFPKAQRITKRISNLTTRVHVCSCVCVRVCVCVCVRVCV